MDIFGTHGTTVRRAVSIQSYGFSSNVGRGGRGVYLWAEGKYAEDLAKEWYYQRLGTNGYRDEANPQGTVLSCGVTLNEDEFLFCEAPNIKTILSEIGDKLKSLSNLTTCEISRCYDYMVKHIEEQSKRKVAVLQFCVNPPARSSYPVKLLGFPVCYVVRDPARVRVIREKPI